MVDDQASLKIQNVNRQFTAMGNQVGTTQGRINSFNSAINTNSKTFTASATAIKTQGNALTGLQNNIKANSTQFTTLGSKVKATASQFAGMATGIAVTTSGALQLAAGFRDYNDAQIAVDRVTRKLSLATEAQHKAQDKLNGLTAAGVKSGKAYEQAQLDVSQANAAVSIQTDLLGEAQERMFDSQTQFVASVIPTTLGALGTLGSAFKDLGGPKGIGGLADKFKGLGSSLKGGLGISSITSLIGPLALAIGPLVIGLLAWESAQRKVTAVTAEMDKAKHIENITTRIQAMNKSLDKLKEPFDIPAFNFLSKLGPGGLIGPIIDKTKELNKQQQESFRISAQLKTAQDKYNTALANYNNAIKSRWKGDDAAAKSALDLAKADLDGIKTLASKSKGTDDARIAVQKLDKAQKDAAKSQSLFQSWALQSKGFEGTTKSINLTTKAYLDVHDAIVKTNPAITANITKTKEQNEMQKQMAKTLANLSNSVRIQGSTFLGLGAPLDTIKAKFKAFYDTVKQMPNANVAQFNNLLKNWGGGIVNITDKTRKLAEESKFLAKIGELAWGAPATSRFAHFQTFGTKAYDEIAAKAEAARTKAEAFAQSVESARASLQKAFHIKLDDTDKFLKQFEKLLPNKISKKIKLDLDFTKNIPQITTDIQNLFKEASQLDEGTAEQMAKTLIKTLDKSFGKKVEKAFPGLTAAIQAAIADPNTPAALAKLIETYPWLANIKEIPIPTTFIPPPPPPAPKTPVKIPAVLVFGGSSNIRTGSQAGAYGGPGKLGFGPPQSGGKKLKKIGGQFPNEFTQGGNDFQNRLDNARHKPDPEEDLGTHPIQGWPVSSGGGKTMNAAPQINIEMALKQIDVLAKRLIGLSAIMPVITLNNAAAIKAIDVIAVRLSTLSAIKPVITLINNAAIKAIDVIAVRIASLTGIQPSISLLNKLAIKVVDVVAKRINDLTSIKPDISLQNKKAIKTVDVVAKRIDSLTKIKPDISLSNTKAFKVVDAVAKRIMSLENLNPTVTVHVKTVGGAISAQKGLHAYLLEDTTIMAHKGERVDIGHGGEGKGGGVTFNNMGGGSGGGRDTIIENHIHIGDENLLRKFTARSGRNRFTMGA